MRSASQVMAFAVAFLPSASLGLTVERGGQTVTVGGDHFKITVDAAKGGELSRLELFDGTKWNTFFAAPAITFPRIRLADKQGEYALANDREGKLLNVTESPEKVVIKTQGVPRGKDGKASSWQVSFEYEVHSEGAVFIDVTYDLKAGTFALVRSTVCLEAGEGIRKGPKFADQNFCPSIGGFRSGRMAFGRSNGTVGTIGRMAMMMSSSGFIRTVSFQPSSLGSGVMMMLSQVTRFNTCTSYRWK